MKKLFSMFGKEKRAVPEMPEWEEIVGMLYDKSLDCFDYEVVKVVYSKETPIKPLGIIDDNKAIPASIAFVPSVAGLIIASEVVKDIISEE